MKKIEYNLYLSKRYHCFTDTEMFKWDLFPKNGMPQFLSVAVNKSGFFLNH